MSSLKTLIGDIVASPLGEVIASVGQGVADAQEALDDASLAKVLEIYTEGDDEKLKLLQEIGYRPTFYTLPDTTGEVRVALRLGSGAPGAGPARPVKTVSPTVAAVAGRAGLTARLNPAMLKSVNRLYAAPVDAGYANSYGYSADISAKLTFRIVPVPPPDGADELRRLPDLRGRTVDAARAALDALGLAPAFETPAGDPITTPDAATTIASQIPAPGDVVRLGDEIGLRLQG
ncbi:MAG: PASTA domain-containing protein [Marinibacterium sp.]|nr:PASTA domain-containing protein [Marinibacterium sp.]